MASAAYQQDKQLVTLEVSSEPDGEGRQSFTAHWWAEFYHTGPQWRAQVFRGDVAAHAAKWESHGWKTQIVRAEA